MNTPHTADTVDSAASHYMLGILLLAYILSFIDRNILALLVGPIRQDFGISDFQFSLLHGLAFTLFYIFLGLPLGWLADRASRKWIITSGVFFWSIMTCLCGFAKSFGSLFVTRIGVGVGEATLSPAAYSLLSDLYSPGKLRWATSIFAMGITLGSGTSYMIGGWLYERLAATDLSAYPVIGDMAAWQVTFVGVGLPGMLVVLLMLFMLEPQRRGSAHVSAAQAIPVREVVRYLVGHWQAYSAVMMGVSMMAIIGYGTLIWYPEFLVRTYSMSKAQAGAALGAIFIFAGTGGTFAGAWFAGQLQKRGYSDANMRTVMLAAAVLIVPATAAPLMPQGDWALYLATLVIFIHYTHFGITMAALQLMTPNRMRAQTSAILLFLTNLFGLALGGSIIAFFTDFVFADDADLRYSLAVVSALCYPAAAIIVGLGLKHYRAALAETTEVLPSTRKLHAKNAAAISSTNHHGAP